MENAFNGIANGIINAYGIQPLSFEGEWNQPENAKRTRQNKMKIIDTCKFAKNLIETIELTARRAPELDDERHSALVQELADKVNEMYKAVETAWAVGKRKEEINMKMKGLTVEDLYKLCGSLIAHGYKDKEVLISQDDEGNGYHTLWGEVIAETNEVRSVSRVTFFHDGNNPEDVILLG